MALNGPSLAAAKETTATVTTAATATTAAAAVWWLWKYYKNSMRISKTIDKSRFSVTTRAAPLLSLPKD